MAKFHVRRADVIAEGKSSRKYYAIEDYIGRLHQGHANHTTILLLTDDANAIDEALEFHPEYDWKFINRTRHRGKEGGYQNHLPSGDPLTEMQALVTAYQLVQRCDTIVRGEGSLGNLLLASMQLIGKHSQVRDFEIAPNRSRLNLDSDKELGQRLKLKRNQIGPVETKLN